MKTGVEVFQSFFFWNLALTVGNEPQRRRQTKYKKCDSDAEAVGRRYDGARDGTDDLPDSAQTPDHWATEPVITFIHDVIVVYKQNGWKLQVSCSFPTTQEGKARSTFQPADCFREPCWRDPSWSALPNTELILTAAGSDDSDPNPRDGNADVVFNVFKSPELVFVMKGGRVRQWGWGSAVGSLHEKQSLISWVAHTHTNTHKLLKCALHSCQWLCNSCCASLCVRVRKVYIVQSVHGPWKRPVALERPQSCWCPSEWQL